MLNFLLISCSDSSPDSSLPNPCSFYPNASSSSQNEFSSYVDVDFIGCGSSSKSERSSDVVLKAELFKESFLS